MKSLFEHRSGRIIALGRLILASVFLIALWADPGQPTRGSAWGYVPIATYLLFSIILMVIAMKSWWWDHRLAWPVLGLDILAFLAAVFVTESVNSDFTSPFLAFFSFVMLTATIRWDWRVTAAAGLLVTMLWNTSPHDPATFAAGTSVILTIGLLACWIPARRAVRVDPAVALRHE